MSDSNEGLEFFKGMLFGGAVGAILALLYAPKSGEELREDLRKGLLEASDEAEEKLELIQKHAEKLLAETREQLRNLRQEQAASTNTSAGKATRKTASSPAKAEASKKTTKKT